MRVLGGPLPSLKLGLEGGEGWGTHRYRWQAVPQSYGRREEGVQVGIDSGLEGLQLAGVATSVPGVVLQYSGRGGTVELATQDFMHQGDLVGLAAVFESREVEAVDDGRGAGVTGVVLSDSPRSTTLCGLQFVDVGLAVGVPHRGGILQHWSHEGLVAVRLYWCGASFQVPAK